MITNSRAFANTTMIQIFHGKNVKHERGKSYSFISWIIFLFPLSTAFKVEQQEKKSALFFPTFTYKLRKLICEFCSCQPTNVVRQMSALPCRELKYLCVECSVKCAFANTIWFTIISVNLLVMIFVCIHTHTHTYIL